ncbi:MAG: hypothetical protein H3C38_02475 [Rhodospirillales bacterium]|nr:hypothetical protein [Rhodospirillales bacterium]
MAKQPEERAVEIMAEMDALIRSCEQQIEQGREFYRASGIDPEVLSAAAQNLPENRRREIQEAVDRDMREIEEEVRQAKLAADHGRPSSGKAGRKMRPMI